MDEEAIEALIGSDIGIGKNPVFFTTIGSADCLSK
jgi:hypothetical protein